ncbi:MAG: DUF86 domain-containing protein [Candidatus Jordarchaeaceae archaeon]
MSRLLAYRRKINYVTSTLGDLPSNLDDKHQFQALLYCLHTSIEALMDIVAMMVKDLGLEVGDDYSNIESLESAKIIKKDVADYLRKLNGLRNAIVHRYNKFDEKIVLEELNEVLNHVSNFLEVVEGVLQKIFRTDKEGS